MAYAFDGTGDHIDYATNTDYLILGDLSYYMLIRLSSTATQIIAVLEAGDGEDETENNILYLDIKGATNAWDIRYIHEFGAGSNELFTFDTNIANDTWVAFGVVRDVTANTVKLWLDGTLVNTFNYTNDPTVGATTTVPFLIGKRTTSFDGKFDGAEIGLWNAAIPDAAMLSLTKVHASPLFWRDNLLHYSPWVRETDDIAGAHADTVTGATLITHPSVLYPTQVISGFDVAATPPAGISIPVVYHHRQRNF